ncbi:MAG: ATP-dependent helicase HrpB [Bradymonadia bacterium]
MNAQESLPIQQHLEFITTAVAERSNLVIIAEPGSGKTTRVPTAIAAALDGRVIVSQPRRIAARTTAQYMSRLQNERVGETVGYRVRHDSQVSSATKVEVVTEGILQRLLESDPFLEGISCLIFDEFHERSLQVDLCLAMAREIQQSLKPELRIIVMSATLDPEPVAQFLDAETLRVEGRTYPVDIVYAPSTDERQLIAHAAQTIKVILRHAHAGHMLVFCPGVAEIEKLYGRLRDTTAPSVEVLKLHGRLATNEQKRAFIETDKTKVILATNIAQTSITVDGVATVVDLGLARIPRFDKSTQLERLETVRIDLQSAEQRAGRAGRTRAGTCYRLWSQAIQNSLADALAPEIERLDLSSTVLSVRAWGSKTEDFGWFQPPSGAASQAALSTLEQLGALSSSGVTPIGQLMSTLPLPPRIARMLVSAVGTEQLKATATLAALLSSRDILNYVPDIYSSSDLDHRLDALSVVERGGSRADINVPLAREVLKTRQDFLKILHGLKIPGDAVGDSTHTAIDCFLHAFPERVAKRRTQNGERFLLANGYGAKQSEKSLVRQDELVCALSLRAAKRGTRDGHVIELAHGIAENQLKLETDVLAKWDETHGRATVYRITRYGQIILREQPVSARMHAEECAQLLAQQAAKNPVKAFGLSQPSPTQDFIARYRWYRSTVLEHRCPPLTFLEPQDAPCGLLIALCSGLTRFHELQEMDLIGFIRGQINYEDYQRFESMAPTHYQLPDGSRKPLTYHEDGRVSLSCRFERLFGLDEAPTIAGQHILLYLLAPNMRPVQTTQDLPNFWRETYPSVRKELRGRYPKHPWPEDPLTAPPGIHRSRNKKKGT